MTTNNLKNNLDRVIEDFNFNSKKEYKLIALFGLLGDFDSFEYAINLKNFINSNQDKEIDIFAIGIGSKIGKEKFCKFTGFPRENLEIVSDNKIHTDLMASKGVDLGLGGWINMLIMLSGFNSVETIKEVIRGYTGDKNSRQIFSAFDEINLFNYIKFSGNLFKYTCGEGYLRPFELATFRLKNMIEIINNWNDYVSSSHYLPQRGASFILNCKNQIIYKYSPNHVLGYSPVMRDPLKFLRDICE